MFGNCNYLFKYVLIGDTNVGKSCLLSRFSDNYYSKLSMSTIGVDFKVKVIEIDNMLVKMQIYDTAGQCRFRTITNSYYRFANGVIIVFDITNRESFNNIKKWLDDVDKLAPLGVVKILVGTKSDLDHERKVSKYEIQLLANELDIKYIETSAKDNNNIEYVFYALSKKIIENGNIYYNSMNNKTDTKSSEKIKISFNEKIKNNIKSCC